MFLCFTKINVYFVSSAAAMGRVNRQIRGSRRRRPGGIWGETASDVPGRLAVRPRRAGPWQHGTPACAKAARNCDVRQALGYSGSAVRRARPSPKSTRCGRRKAAFPPLTLAANRRPRSHCRCASGVFARGMRNRVRCQRKCTIAVPRAHSRTYPGTRGAGASSQGHRARWRRK